MPSTRQASTSQPQSPVPNSPNNQPTTTTPPPAPLPIEGPNIVNIVCGVNLNCLIDLRSVALHALNARYAPKRFQAVTLRQREPKSCALVFASGKMQVLGTRSVADARLAARKFARIIQKLGYQVRMTGFNVQNLVAHVNVKFTVRLEGLLATRHSAFCSYEPEIFPGLIYRIVKPKVSLLVFTTGKIVLLGAKREEDLEEAMRLMFPLLKEHRLLKASDAKDVAR